jgi:hypothetical protein
MTATTTAPSFLKPWHGCIEHNHNHCPGCRSCDCYGPESHDTPEARAAGDRAWVNRVLAANPGMRRPVDPLETERARWVAAGCPPECVRPAGEAFGWRQGSGPCDCPPCLARSAAAWTPRTDDGPTV